MISPNYKDEYTAREIERVKDNFAINESRLKSIEKRANEKQLDKGVFEDLRGVCSFASNYVPDEAEDFEREINEYESGYNFDPSQFPLWVKNIVKDLAELCKKAFKLFLENLKSKEKQNLPKNKENNLIKESYQTVNANNKSKQKEPPEPRKAKKTTRNSERTGGEVEKGQSPYQAEKDARNERAAKIKDDNDLFKKYEEARIQQEFSLGNDSPEMSNEREERSFS